jgi:hypothetical protein
MRQGLSRVLTGGDCAADATARVAATEGNVDVLRPLVYCDDSGSGDGLTKAEAKCADTVAKTLSNFAKKKLNCLSKCRKDEHKGKVPVGSCTPPPSDPRASGCVAKEFSKAGTLIDKQCEASVNPKADKTRVLWHADRGRLGGAGRDGGRQRRRRALLRLAERRVPELKVLALVRPAAR